MKDRLARGEAVLAVNIDYTNAGLVEFVGRLGVDAVFIDCEQGGTGVESIEDLARAARCAGVTSLVRLFSPDDWVIERYLGRGVSGIVVPRLEDAAGVRRVVEAVRYCYPQAHRDKVVVVQVETAGAARGIDAILAVEGVDVLFIGPVDLAKSMGHRGDFRHPEVAAEIERLIDRIHASGGRCGILVDEASIDRYRRRGVQFLYCHVNDFLRAGARRFVVPPA